MSLITDTKISRKLVFCFSIIVVLTLLMAVLSFFEMQKIENARNVYAKAQELNQAYREYDLSFYEQRENLYYFLLTGDQLGLKRYNQQKSVVKSSYDELHKLASEYPEALAYVKELSQLHNKWQSNYASKQVDLMRNYLTVNQARAIEATGQPGEVASAFDEIAHKLGARLDQITQNSVEMQNSAFAEFRAIILISLAAMVIVSVFFGIVLAKIIATPISQITNLMSELAKNNLNIQVLGTDRKDEIGGMARAVEVFKQNAIQQTRMQEEERQKQLQDKQRSEAVDSLTANFDQKMESVLDVVTSSVSGVSSSSEKISKNADTTGDLSQQALSGIEEASNNIQTVSAAASELSSSIQEISRQTTETSKISKTAVEEVEQTNQRVSALSDAAQSIGQIIGIIGEIADQTNLLALNATIESARAGEAGKGFAVVAGEVKGLASQTGKATEEISQKIAEIQSETETAAQAVLGIGQTINKIDELTTTISSAVEEQSAATSEIARNVDGAAQSAQQVASAVKEVSQAAGDTKAYAQEQDTLVEELNKQNVSLKDDVSTFLTEVKKA